MTYHSGAVQLGSTRRLQPPAPGAPWYKHLWHGWKRIAHMIGDLLSRVVTSLAYVVVIPWFGVGVRLFADPLQLKPAPPRWSPLPPSPESIEQSRGGF